MLLAECWRWGADEDFVRSLLPAADAALAWAKRYGDRTATGLSNTGATDRGLINQGWKDSFDGINDATGHTADPPIALCEVQGYQYAAAGQANWPTRSANHRRRRGCASAPTCCRRGSSTRSGCPSGAGMIALDGRKRPIDALTSNVGHCVDGDRDRRARRGDRRGLGFGLRTLATTMGAYNPMSYHNGSVWPHDTAIAVAGLLRYRHVPGAVPLAERLAIGLLDAGDAFGGRLPGFSAASRDLSSLVRCPIPRHVRRRRGPALRRCCWCAPSSGCTRTADSSCPRCRGPGAVSR